MPNGMEDLITAITALKRFSGSRGLTSRISTFESDLRGLSGPTVADLLSKNGVESQTLVGALAVKAIAGQINVVVHALGILLALPAILEEGEVVEDLSLGAGNTGHDFDLETNRRIAEFKFITWQGGPESIRQNGLFVDLYHLAEANTDKLRQLYVTDLVHPLRFLEGGRSMRSILSKHAYVAEKLSARHGDRYKVARDYWNDVRERVEIIDVSTLVPALSQLPLDDVAE